MRYSNLFLQEKKMKKLFCCVMILSLLLAVFGCSNDLIPKQETELSGAEESAHEQGVEDGASGGSGEQGGNEPVTPEVEPPETEPPEVEPPEVEPPEIEPSVISLLEINELRTEYNGTAKRAEYVEFKAKQSGNLNGLSLHIMYEKNNPFVYDFPDIDVALGEYITLHLRTLEDGCIDELEDDLALSGGTDSCPTARDLWVSGSDKLLHSTDIAYLQDENGKILDAVVMNETPSDAWNKSQAHFAGIMENLFNAGMWKAADGQTPTPLDAVDTSSINTAATKSVSRYENQENTHTAEDWHITAQSGATPGMPNK